MVEIIITIVLANSSNPQDSQKLIENSPKNVLWLTRLVAMLARAAPQNQPLYDPHSIIPTPEIFFCPNTPYLTIPDNVPLTLKTISPLNISYLTTLAVISARAAS